MAVIDLIISNFKNITAIGLVLDLLGVSLLGIDLIRVQNNNKRQSDSDQDNLNRVSDDFGGVESWLEDITKMGRWNTGTMDEGRYVFYDGFDGDAAERAFSDLAKASLASQQNIERIAALVLRVPSLRSPQTRTS